MKNSYFIILCAFLLIGQKAPEKGIYITDGKKIFNK